MSTRQRPAWEPVVQVARSVRVELELDDALELLAAVHELRCVSSRARDPEHLAKLRDFERALGLAIGAEEARAWILSRARRASP